MGIKKALSLLQISPDLVYFSGDILGRMSARSGITPDEESSHGSNVQPAVSFPDAGSSAFSFSCSIESASIIRGDGLSMS
jgi:hypothetical protein